MAKIKKRFGKWGGYLPHCIDGRPTIDIKKEEMDGEYYIKANDEFFIMNNDLFGNIYLYIGLALYFFMLLTIAIRLSADKDVGFIFLFFLFSFGTLSIIYNYTAPVKKIILDRLNGIVTFPNFLWGKPICMPFKDMLVAWSVKNSGINPSGPSLSAFHPNGFFSTDIMGADVLEDWYFIVWYMDKNRPLPPGTAFDEYREKDYLRRKSEGFPEGLYPCSIHIPEYKPSKKRK